MTMRSLLPARRSGRHVNASGVNKLNAIAIQTGSFDPPARQSQHAGTRRIQHRDAGVGKLPQTLDEEAAIALTRDQNVPRARSPIEKCGPAPLQFVPRENTLHPPIVGS